MKIFKSIKWRLQLWYGLILVAVLAALGATAYQLERNLQLSRIDGELQRRFPPLTDALRGHGRGPGRPPFAGMPPDQIPGDLPPPPEDEDGQRRGFHLPPQAEALFDSGDPHNFYFIIYRDGEEFARSTNAPTANIFARDDSIVLPSEPGAGSGRPPQTATEGDIRVSIHTLPSGETIIIGGNITNELHELNMTALTLAGVGAIILFFGLAGGWWISSRAIRPVETISATAVKISAGDLSQRINSAETESELGQLAAVLNSTFARLEAAFAQQKQFASDAAHELRTPVSVILTQTQTALNRDREASEYKQTVEACQRAAQRMKKLIGALLELARLDAGQEQMKRLRFDLSKTAGDCVELIKPLADERHVKLVVELSPIEIEGDSERLAQTITNLLSNAIQYNHEGGQVRINAKAENGMAVLTVSDTGQGIPADDLPRVFERFYRADRSRSSGNSGLGLAISKAIVSAHGGTIEVASEENAGTTFTLRLPARGTA
jgi:two-component system OmpR family sensor kinase